MAQVKINSRQFAALVVKEFPQLRDDIREWRGLVHLQMMEFVLFTKKACKDGDWVTVKKCLRLADKLLRFGDGKVKNAVYVSYLESLPRKGKAHDWLRKMMSANLRKDRDDILAYLSKLLAT